MQPPEQYRLLEIQHLPAISQPFGSPATAHRFTCLRNKPFRRLLCLNQESLMLLYLTSIPAIQGAETVLQQEFSHAPEI